MPVDSWFSHPIATIRASITSAQLITALRIGTAVLATFATLTVIMHFTHQSDELIVLGVIICLTSTRSALGRGPMTKRRLLFHSLTLVTLTAVVSEVGTLFIKAPVAGDALFIAAAFAALWTARFQPEVRAVARLIQLPLLALFIAPVPPIDRGTHGIPWLILVAFVATSFATLVQLPGSATPGPRTPEPRRTPASGKRILGTTKLGLQTAVGLTAAFAIGQNFFSPRWTWTVVSAFTVGAGARSRGDVLLKGTERLLGAIAGTAVATGAIVLAGGHRDLSVFFIFLLLLVGLVLREKTYAAWAFCVTGALALLYGIFGEQASQLLPERLAEVAIGSACAIAAAVVVMPIKTEAITRRSLADTLAAVDTMLVQLTEQAHEDEITETYALIEMHALRLRVVSRPLRVARRLGLPGGHVAEWVTLAETHVTATKVRAMAKDRQDPRVLGAERRSIGSVRRHLRSALPPLDVAFPPEDSDVPPGS